MIINRDIKIIEAILFASNEPVLEDDLKDKIREKNKLKEYLLNSYSLILKKKEQINHLTINPSELYSVDQAIQRLKDIFSSITEWTNFMNLIPKFGQNLIINKSSITSNFVASLELAKNGFIDVKQNETFGNIFLKYRKQ